MKKTITLILLTISLSLFAEPLSFICAGKGVTETGEEIYGLVQIAIDVDNIKEAFETNNEETITRAIVESIKLQDASYGENMTEHSRIMNSILKNYQNSTPEYQVLPLLTGFDLKRKSEGIYFMEHRLNIYQPGKEKDQKTILLLKFSAQDERLKF